MGIDGRGSGARRLAALMSAVTLMAAPSLVAGQRWLRDRHDPQLTGRSELRGSGPGAPAPTASLDLGGTAGDALLGDVDGDGAPEAVFLRGGHVVVTGPSGRTILDRFAGATDLVAIADLDRDGRGEVVYINEGERVLAALDVAAKAVRWQYTFPEYATLAPQYVKIAELSAARPGLEVVVFPEHLRTTGDASGYFFDARGALYANPVVKQWNGAQLHFPQVAVADVDGAGDPEVVVVGRPRLMLYGSDGRLLREREFISGEPEGRHYGALVVANVDADPELEAVVVSDLVPTALPGRSQAINVFDLAPAIREVWGFVAAHGDRLGAVLGGVRDFDGDGAADVAVNRYDGATQNVEIYRGAGDEARPGKPKLLAGRANSYLWDVADLDADGTPELFATEATEQSPTLSYNSRLEVLRVEGGGAGRRIAALGEPVPRSRYVMLPVRTSDLVLNAGASDARKGVATATVDGAPVFVTDTKADAAAKLQFRGLGARATKVQEAGRRPGTIKAVFDGATFLVVEGAGDEASGTLALYAWSAAGRKLAKSAEFRAGGFTAGDPLVADLDGDGRAELVVRLPGKRVAAYAYDPATRGFTQKWEAEGNSEPVVDADAARPADARVYVMAPDKRARAMLVAHDGRGGVVWKAKFPEIPAGAKPLLVAGQFTGEGPRDLWVSIPRVRSWVVDGRDGRVVWESGTAFHFGNRVAVRDQNGDGADDLVVVSNNMFGVYSGRDGRAIVTPRLVTELNADFYSTPVAMPDGAMLLVGASTLAKLAASGSPLWNARRTSPRVRGELLVGVAHGAGGVERIGGNFGADGKFIVYDYATGRVVLALPQVAITDVNTADSDGDGVDEFVFGTADGRVVALRSDTGQEVWSLDVGAFSGAPVVASLTGRFDVIVPVGDGTVQVFSK